MVIREEGTRDQAAIRVLYRAIFGRENESLLVDRLRDAKMTFSAEWV